MLKKGIDKMKNCIVSRFTKGKLAYNKLVSFANNALQKLGLSHVAQKDDRTFTFIFASEAQKNTILARGTWYIHRQPLVMTAWGTNLCSIRIC